MQEIIIDGNSLNLEAVAQVALEHAPIRLSEESIAKVKRCREYVESIIAKGDIVYGLTTGFGKFSTVCIEKENIAELQVNLIRSHAVSVGEPYNEPITRAIMLLRIAVLAKGHSGIRIETLQTLVQMLNSGIHPVIPMRGSVGASGDLSPLSHLALVLIGEGEAKYKGEKMSGAEAMQKAGIQTVKLEAKEGLALNNGTQVMAAIGVLSLIQAENLCKQADILAAMSIDGLLGTPNAMNPLVHALRPHPGQLASARNIHKLLENSPLRKSHRNCPNVQDAYSLRCTPQVHGAVRDALTYVRGVLEIEINSATDNPLIFPEEKQVISGGNFHGEPLAIALDSMAIAISELANISERRMEQMLNPALSRGLPPFLAHRPGLDSGYMIIQLTAASAISENKVLAHPASVDSIPTSANQEDHVSMGSVSAIKLMQIIENVSTVLAIEWMIAAQAIDLRQKPSSSALEMVKARLREFSPQLAEDRVMYPELHKSVAAIKANAVLTAVEQSGIEID
ncbi:MAG: histidine ammonia-lyase [Candidatus Cloacimonetes bacterium]|jgi:histidine ammonia-lyase|nr:histidine ammonia-lyase [Candidatus Cloacimonadota bacterium]MDD2506064.1 histidine ammonia-lyase [Candidatus Cloacimonadota bacterium]MDD4559647.1 histidine ammonia-lyase [Candidatus Cloacimonadota bacterium]